MTAHFSSAMVRKWAVGSEWVDKYMPFGFDAKTASFLELEPMPTCSMRRFNEDEGMLKLHFVKSKERGTYGVLWRKNLSSLPVVCDVAESTINIQLLQVSDSGQETYVTILRLIAVS